MSQEGAALLPPAVGISADLHDEATLGRVYNTGPGATSLHKVAEHVHPRFVHVAAGTLPSPGAFLQCLSQAASDGQAYDAALLARQAAALC